MIRLSKAFAIIRKPDMDHGGQKNAMTDIGNVESTNSAIEDCESVPSKFDAGNRALYRRSVYESSSPGFVQ